MDCPPSARTLLLVVALLAPSGACSAEARTPEPRRVVKGEADLVLPLDAYDLNVTERSVVQSARYRLIEQCLSEYRLSFQPHNTKPVTYPKNASYLGWLSAKQVGRYGYSGPPGQVTEASAAATGIRGYPIPRSQEAVQVGTVRRFRGKAVPQEGCDGKAQRTLNGSAPGPDGVTSAKPSIYKYLYIYMDDAADLAYRDKRVTAANAGWSACMRRWVPVHDAGRGRGRQSLGGERRHWRTLATTETRRGRDRDGR